MRDECAQTVAAERLRQLSATKKIVFVTSESKSPLLPEDRRSHAVHRNVAAMRPALNPIIIMAVACNIVVDPRIDVLSHYAFIVDDNEHEYQDDRQKNAVDHLRKVQNREQRGVGDHYHEYTDYDDPQVQPVKHGRFAETF